jgi:hypothetical protein
MRARSESGFDDRSAKLPSYPESRVGVSDSLRAGDFRLRSRVEVTGAENASMRIHLGVSDVDGTTARNPLGHLAPFAGKAIP